MSDNFIVTESLKTAETLDKAKDMLLDAIEKTVADSISHPSLRGSSAFERMYSKINVAIETMRAGAGTVSSVVSELPKTVKVATINFCDSIKKGSESIWKAIQDGSASLSKTIEKAWGAIIASLGKVFAAIAPLVDKGKEVLEKASNELSKKAKQFQGSVRKAVKSKTKKVSSFVSKLESNRKGKGKGSVGLN